VQLHESFSQHANTIASRRCYLNSIGYEFRSELRFDWRSLSTIALTEITTASAACFYGSSDVSQTELVTVHFRYGGTHLKHPITIRHVVTVFARFRRLKTDIFPHSFYADQLNCLTWPDAY
jgi:hypothetical protein